MSNEKEILSNIAAVLNATAPDDETAAIVEIESILCKWDSVEVDDQGMFVVVD